jgi:hypothetical protein
MRGLRSFLGLLAILIALGAYLYLVESKRTPGADEDEKEKVFAVQENAIDEITIKAESGETTTLRKSGSDWQIVAPTTAPADSAEISGLTMNLSSLEQQRVIDENPADVKEFGLAEPRVEVTFKSGGQEQKLQIGSKTPTGGDVYARTAASPKVFLIASYLDATFNRSTFDLRDKTALTFERDAADAMEVATGDRVLKFGKVQGEWQLTDPATKRSDQAAIEGLLARIDGLQMKAVETASPESLSKYGLDKPAASVTIGTGSARATLLVGTQSEEGSVYAKDASRPDVFTIDASVLDDLKRDAGEYRQKDLFDARSFNTTRVEIARGGQTTTYEKTTVKSQDGKEEQKWQRVAPSAGEVDGAKVDALLSTITGLRADSFVPKPPANAQTELTIALTFDGGKTERVTFFKSGSDVYAAREGADGAGTILPSTIDDIVKALPESPPAGGQTP